MSTPRNVVFDGIMRFPEQPSTETRLEYSANRTAQSSFSAIAERFSR